MECRTWIDQFCGALALVIRIFEDSFLRGFLWDVWIWGPVSGRSCLFIGNESCGQTHHQMAEKLASVSHEPWRCSFGVGWRWDALSDFSCFPGTCSSWPTHFSNLLMGCSILFCFPALAFSFSSSLRWQRYSGLLASWQYRKMLECVDPLNDKQICIFWSCWTYKKKCILDYYLIMS